MVSDTFKSMTGLTPVAVTAAFGSLPKPKAIAYGNQLASLANEYAPFKGIKRIGKISFKSTSKYNGFIKQSTGGAVIGEINFGNAISQGRSYKKGDIETRSKSRVDDDKVELATLTHEFAHLLSTKHQVTVANDPLDKRIRPFWGEMEDLRKEYHAELFKASQPGQPADALYEISLGKYASFNANEFMAEAFTEYKLSSSPSKYAILAGKLIDKYFKK